MIDIEKENLLSFLKQVSESASCPRASCATLIVRGGTVLAYGANGSAIGEPTCNLENCIIENNHCVRSLHSEARAVAQAARNGISLEGATAVMLERPCMGCMSILAEAGIVEAIYVNDYHSKAHGEQYDSPHLKSYLRLGKWEEEN